MLESSLWSARFGVTAGVIHCKMSIVNFCRMFQGDNIQTCTDVSISILDSYARYFSTRAVKSKKHGIITVTHFQWLSYIKQC